MMTRILSAIVLVVTVVGPAQSQEPIPQPTGPVLFCGTQASPEAASYAVIFDDGERQAITLAGVHEACPDDPTLTHSFLLTAEMFDLGEHTVQIVASNAFGETVGPTYLVGVGLTPGAFTIHHVVVLPPGA